MSDFSFNPQEKWAVSTDELLPKGNHVCEILEIEAGDRDSSGSTSGIKYPQVQVKVGNATGSIRDWITISDSRTFGKFTSLVLAAGFEEGDWPVAGEDFNTDTGRITQAYANKLLGRQVGVVVREEPDNRDLTGQKTQLRVNGYVLPEEITGQGSDMTKPGDQFEFQTGTKTADDKIPF